MSLETILLSACASDRGVANALQRILDVLESEDDASRAAVKAACVNNASILVSILSTPSDTVRCRLAMSVMCTILQEEDVVEEEDVVMYRFLEAGLFEALGRVIVARSNITDDMVREERYPKDFHGLLPVKKLEGNSDVWRNVFAFHHDSAAENEEAAKKCTDLYDAAMKVCPTILSLTHLLHPSPSPISLTHLPPSPNDICHEGGVDAVRRDAPDLSRHRQGDAEAHKNARHGWRWVDAHERRLQHE